MVDQLLDTLARIRQQNSAMLSRRGISRSDWDAMSIPEREALIRKDHRLTNQPD